MISLSERVMCIASLTLVTSDNRDRVLEVKGHTPLPSLACATTHGVLTAPCIPSAWIPGTTSQVCALPGMFGVYSGPSSGVLIAPRA